MVYSNIKERINIMQKFITILLICLIFPNLSEAITVKHNFFVTVGLFDASKTEFTYTLNKSNYKIASKVMTNGFFNTIYPFEANYITSGTIKNSQMTTIDYNYESKSKSTKEYGNFLTVAAFFVSLLVNFFQRNVKVSCTPALTVLAP